LKYVVHCKDTLRSDAQIILGAGLDHSATFDRRVSRALASW